MIKVFLREKKITKGRKSLYLDFYPPILNHETNQYTRREHLRMFIYEKPKNEAERNHNKELKIIGEKIRLRRQTEVLEENYGFVSTRSRQKSFLTFFEEIVESKKKLSQSSYDNWNSVYKYLKSFTDNQCRFADLSPKFCEKFKEFLLNSDKLSQNTASNYFDKFKVAVRQAFDDKLLPNNPAYRIKSIKMLNTQREFLTYEEIIALASTDFEYDDLRRAALFSCLTGLRFSDIEKLIWAEVQYSDQNGYYLRFRQQKTMGAETLFIPEDAFNLLGDRGKDAEKVFQELRKDDCSKLKIWTKKAGINRHITFHSFRHTFATLLVTLGEEIYTISDLLGHKNVKTTKIYAKIIDKKKREAMNKIKLK